MIFTRLAPVITHHWPKFNDGFIKLSLKLGGGVVLRASQIPEAMPTGVLTPGRYNHAGQALG